MPKPLSPRALSDDALTLIAARFRTLAEPSRLKLLGQLELGAKTVNALVAATGLKQANVSRHLQTLAEAGLVARERRGSTVVYSLADPGIFELCHLVCGGIQKRLRHQARLLGA